MMPVQYQPPFDMRPIEVADPRVPLRHAFKAQIDRTMLMETEA